MLGLLLAPALLVSGASAQEPGLAVRVSGPHHHVLHHWLRAAERQRLPRSGVTVVHVDAHPDLAVPRGPLRPGWPEHPSGVVALTDIATFQLAAVRVGLVAEVVWLRPRWARQLPDGPRRFRLGMAATGAAGHALRVDDPSDYYVLDDGWAPSEELHLTQPVRVRVLPLDAALDEERLGEGSTIFDIDLDVFATFNPAAERLRRAGLSDGDLDRIREIFAPAGLRLAPDPPERIRQVAELQEAVATLADARWRRLGPGLRVLWRRGIGPRDMASLWGILGRAEGTAIDALVEDGRDVVGLPERRGDPAEIARTAELLGALLARGIVRPALVTIARSVDDGFTPRSDWPGIEAQLLAAMRAARPDLELRYDPGLQPVPRSAGSRAPSP